MGRDKGGVKPAKGAAAKENGTASNEPRASPTTCGICRKEVAVNAEEHIQGECSKCGQLPFHRPCVAEYLERILKVQIREGGYGTKAWDKIKEKINTRPQLLFAQNGRAQKLPQQCPACKEGLMEAAEVAKPVRKIAAPPPAPVPRPRGSQQAATAAAAPGKNQAGATPAGSKPAAAAPPAAALRRAVSENRAALSRQGSSGVTKSSSFSGAGAGGGGYHSTFSGRPVWLQMCREVLEGDECYTYNCGYCHSREEQQEREAQYAEEQQDKARQRRQQELEEHKRQQAAQAEAAAAAGAAAEAEAERRRGAMRREVLAREEAALALSDDVLALMKRHKRQACIASLAAMGFDHATSAAAADAAGCELTAAATILTEGEPGGGAVPPSVIREARELLSAAAKLGISAPAVEAALVVADGDWQQALWEVQQQQQHAAAASSSTAAAAAHTAASASSSSTAAPVSGVLSRQTSVASTSTSTPLPTSASGFASASASTSASIYGFLPTPDSVLPATSSAGTGSSVLWPAAPAPAAANGRGQWAQPMDGALSAATAAWQQQQPAAAPAVAALPEPFAPAIPRAAGGADTGDAGYDAGFAAGLAAAMQSASSAAAPGGPARSGTDSWQQQQPQQQLGYEDVSYASSSSAATTAWVPPAQMDRPAPAEEEIDALMQMLGLGS